MKSYKLTIEAKQGTYKVRVIEAYAHQDEQYYLMKRNRNDWRKYI
jgi:hypothetical protein